MESALYGVYTLVVLYQKSHSFTSLTRSISDTPQLVCKHRTHALSMKYSIFMSEDMSAQDLTAMVHLDGTSERNHSQPQCFSAKNVEELWGRGGKECADESISEHGEITNSRSISSIFRTERVLYHCVRCFMRSKPARYVQLHKQDTNCIFRLLFKRQ